MTSSTRTGVTRPGTGRDYAGRDKRTPPGSRVAGADREPRVGDMFGRYRLDELLGAGGVGEVWRALDTTLDRVVAIKMLLPRFRDDPESAARFRREARMVARLRHEHIVKVHQFGEIDGRLFIDMELIEGSSLSTTLDAGPMALPRVLQIADQVAAALDAAHRLDGPAEDRMVHRDVKPGNVLLEPRPGRPEHVYLVDFGVARTVAPGASITGTGAVVGTPAFMAPELWEGHRSDHRIDVYALAVMLFEMVTGQLPYARPTVGSLINAHLREPVPPASAVRGPRALDAVIERGMAKDPRERFGTAGELAAAARVAVEPPPAARPVPPRVEPTDRVEVRRSGGPPAGDPTGPFPTLPPPVAEPAGQRAGAPGSGAVAPPVQDRQPPLPNARRPPGPQQQPDQRRADAQQRPDAQQRVDPRQWADARQRPDGRQRPDAQQRADAQNPPDSPYRPDSTTRPPGRRSYFGSPPHFAGLACTILLIPLYLLNLVRADWSLLVPLVLLYGLGAVVTAVLRPRS